MPHLPGVSSERNRRLYVHVIVVIGSWRGKTNRELTLLYVTRMVEWPLRARDIQVYVTEGYF